MSAVVGQPILAAAALSGGVPVVCAVVGCGYVAEFYARTIGNHSGLRLAGGYDRKDENAANFCRRFQLRQYATLDELLNDPSIEMILNLTNPRSHYEITRRGLEAGKHVYSEKPMAMEPAAARELVALAQQKKLYLASAPCSVLGNTAQTMWQALREGVIGRVRLVYANFDDGLIAPTLAPWQWRNEGGVHWPAKDEFEVGCTYQHAGYLLTWLAAFFGPALQVTSFASCLIGDKGIAVDGMAPDLTVGCIEYADGVVARVTCSLVAPKDKSITIIGDKGVLFTRNVRNDASPVFVREIPSRGMRASVERRVNLLRRRFKLADGADEWYWPRKYQPSRKPVGALVSPGKPVDFCRGPAEMAAAIREQRPCRLSPELGIHITELIEALQYPQRFGGRKRMTSTFARMEPLPAE